MRQNSSRLPIEKRICGRKVHLPGIARVNFHGGIDDGLYGASRLRCFNDLRDRKDRSGGDGDDEDDDLDFYPGDDEDDGYEKVTLLDPETSLSLPCVVEHRLTIGDTTYLVCCPKDDVVTFAKAEAGTGHVPIEERAELDKLFPTAKAVLSENHMSLFNTGFFLTVDDTDAIIMAEDEDDEDDDDDDDDDELLNGDDGVDPDCVEVLGEFYHEGQNYVVVKPEVPMLLVAKETADGVVVSDQEELARVGPLIEEQLEALQSE